jgi:hypothetical protein
MGLTSTAGSASGLTVAQTNGTMVQSTPTLVSFTTGATSNVLTAWTQYVASTASELYLEAVAVTNNDSGARNWRVQVGIGAAASEVLAYDTYVNTPGNGGYSGSSDKFQLPFPMIIPAGSRLAFRVSVNGGSVAGKMYMQTTPTAARKSL